MLSRKGEMNLLLIASILLIVAGFSMMTPKITGAVFGDSLTSDSTIGGLLLSMIGLIGAYYYLRTH